MRLLLEIELGGLWNRVNSISKQGTEDNAIGLKGKLLNYFLCFPA